MGNEKFITCVIIPAENEPYIAHLPNKLESLQQMVDGHIEFVNLAKKRILICNEEGMIIGLPVNEVIRDILPLPNEILGDVIIAARDGEEIVSLDDHSAEYIKELAMKVFEAKYGPMDY